MPPKVQQDINSNSHRSDIGIRRDTASVDYRYTPNDHWDFRANYSNTRRTGTQVDGVLFSPTIGGVRVDAPKPVGGYHAELRRQRRICRHLVLESEIQFQGRL